VTDPGRPARIEASVACAFVGLLDTEDRSGDNAAYSPAGAQFQECLLRALSATELDVTHVYALRPVPSFPTRRLVYTARQDKLADSVPATLIGFVNLGPVKTITGGLTLFPRLFAWAWRERARKRVILLYNLYSPPGIVSVVAGWLTRSKTVAIVADLQIPGQGLLPDTVMRRLDFALQRLSLPHFDGLIVLTNRMAEDFAPDVPRIQMEGAAPDSALVDSPPGQRDTDRGGKFIIMYAGGLSQLKGIDRLLQAFALLEGDHFRLRVTGVGPLADVVARAAAADSRIQYFGFTGDDELRSLYRDADVLVNPHSIRHASARYLFPSKLIEYLATGTPVISTCSTPEIADEYSEFLFATLDDSAEAIAATLRNVAQLPSAERTARGVAARRFILANKSWAAQARRIAKFVCDDSGAREGNQ